jgi:hypothetical protein
MNKTPDHIFNSPGLGAHAFLLAAMYDQTLPLPSRMLAAEGLMRAGLGDISTITTLKVSIEGGIPEGADLTKPHECQYGVVSDAGKAPGHRPARRHRGFYLVKSG